MKREFNVAGLFVLGCSFCLYSANVNVTTNADGGPGSLRQAIIDINSGPDSSNTIQMQIPGNSPISLSSDLPVIKKDTIINSTGKQPIDGNGQYRLFATIMANLSLTNCTLQNGAAIGGNGTNFVNDNRFLGGGLGAGGAIYIDRGKQITLTNTSMLQCKAEGGSVVVDITESPTVGGGASFSQGNKNRGGDFPGNDEKPGESDGSDYREGYGGGDGAHLLFGQPGKGGGNGRGCDGSLADKKGGDGGYCGGGGSFIAEERRASGGGGNGGGFGYNETEEKRAFNGGGFGSGSAAGGGGFGGGGGTGGGGGFGGGGGGAYEENNKLNNLICKGGHFGGNASLENRSAGGGAGLGGAIFVGDTATCIIQDDVSLSGNSVLGGSGRNPGQGYAPDIFLFRKAKVIFDNQQPLNAPYSIMADQKAPEGHLDNGIIKDGEGTLTLTNTNNNYRGETKINGGILSIADPRALGSSSAGINVNGGTLQPTRSMTLAKPISTITRGGNIDTPDGTTLTTTGSISGSGTLNKTSPGTWRQTGTSTHTGDLNIKQGTLQVDGILTSNINVNPTSTLQGTGIAGGNVTNSGTVKPSSDQLGTLTVGGNYTQNPDGLLQLQMKPNNLSDHFLIKGTAQLDGALQLELEPGIYQKNQKYNLIQADGGLNGFFNQISTNSKVQGIIQVTRNNFNVIFDNPQIILPIPTNQLPRNQKALSNYLFCDNFPFENDNLVNLLQNLFALSPQNYIKALATLTPEHYGALPIGESRAIHYLLTQNIPTCIPTCPTTKHTLTAIPLYFRNDIQKHKSIPNYVQNSGGVRVSYALASYPTPFESKASINYVHTHTYWGDHRGKADSNGVYLDVGIGYSMKGFLASLALLGGYSYTDATHNLNIGYPINATSNPHSWDVAESLSLQYTHVYQCIAIIPRLVLTQTNVYLSSICEDKPKCLNLQTDPKYFGFFDTLLSLRLQGQKSHCYCCVKPYVDLGWHNSSHLSNRDFHSKLDNYTACACSFSTETYCGSTNRFFMEWGIAFSFMNNVDLLLNSRTEFAKADFVQAVNLGASWRF